MPLPAASPRAEFIAGVRSQLAILLGVIPFGVIYGVLGVSAGLPLELAQAMSAIVFAGSSQFIGAQMIKDAAPALVIVLTTFVVNLRHMLYAASVQPYIQHLSARWKWLLAYLLTDEAYATTIVHYQRGGELKHKHWFYLGAGLTLWSCWQLSTLAGVAFGSAAQIPAAWGLDFTLALTFIGIVFTSLKDRPTVAAALVAGVVAVLGVSLPYRLGLMLAAISGIAAGVILEELKRPRTLAHP